MLQFGLSNGGQGGRSLDASKLEAAYVGFHKNFHDRLKLATPLYKQLATVIETDNLIDRQVWLSSVPKMRRWAGNKTLHKLRAESTPFVTMPHEASVQVPKHDILNDRLGLWMPRINEMADAYAWALDELVITMYAAGIAGTALGTTYDGQNLVDTDHTALSIGGTSQSNKVTGAFSESVFQTALIRYMSLVDDNGTPVAADGRRLKLVVGPANYLVARDIIAQSTQANGEQNMNLNLADLVVSKYIAARTVNVLGVSVTLTGNEWVLIPEGSLAVMVHVKRPPEFLSVEEGYLAFMNGTYLYGIEAEFGSGYGLWQEVVGGPGS